MIFNCQREDLLLGIQTVGKAISTKSTLPVLSGILIVAENNLLSIRATDLDIAIQATVPADVIQSGELVIADGRRFIEIVRQLPDSAINISLINDCDLNIKYGASSLNIRGFESQQFPILPGLEGEINGSMGGSAFASMIRKTAIAASGEESRPMLTGILVEIKGSQVTMVATDSHRLALARGNWQGDAEARIIIPAKTMLEIAKLAVLEETVYMSISKNNACFKMGSTLFITRLISGNFPDYNPLLPKDEEFVHHVFINKKNLINSLSLANLLSKDNNSSVRLKIQHNRIIMTAESVEIGNIEEFINATATGEEIVVGYNVKYILDALKVMESENIILKLTGPVTPGIIVPEEADNYIYLLLPVRLNN